MAFLWVLLFTSGRLHEWIAVIYDTINDAQTVAGNGEGTILAERYRIVRQLGQGGMGSVWLAEDTQLDNKQFAIKMLPAILVANKRAYRQLKDEALVAMRLVHPNIVQIRAFEENNGNPFLVMDYIDGQTLDDYLAEHGGGNLTQSRREAESQRDLKDGCGYGIPEADVIRILKPIAAALDYAHGEGVVHRDVKPANVMIRKDGHPFILDFGIAREIQETLTRVTGKLSSGTLLYMSPEQLNGSAPKPAQDVYSFAAMVYECLKGEPPFVRGQIDHQILACEPPPLPQEIGIAANVMKGLAKKPEDRPVSCSNILVAAGTDSDKGTGKKGRGWLWLLLLLIIGGFAFGVYWRLAPVPEKVGNTVSTEDPVLPPAETNQTEKATNVVVREDVGVPPTNAVAVGIGDRVNSGSLPTNAVAVAKDTNSAPMSVPDSPSVETNQTVTVETPSVKPPTIQPNPMPVKPLTVPPKPKPSVKPTVDKEFVKLTNDLAVAMAARETAYNAAAEYRRSHRGFAAHLKKIDETWNKQWRQVKPTLSKQEASVALKTVMDETNQLNMWVKWMAEHKKEREDALKKEGAFDQKVDGKKAADTDLFARAERRADWSRVQEMVKSARGLIDKGDFAESQKSFAEAEKHMEDVLAEECANRDAELRKKRAAMTKAFMERLDREGFILDDKANRYSPGTEKRIALGRGEELVMVWCPSGWFMMGSPKSEMGRNEGEARHAVHLSKGFWIGKYEITQQQWAVVWGDSVWWGKNKPKTSVSWNDCKDFIRRLNMQTRLSTRLPTEAEWEYACRAGTHTPFSFGSVLNGRQACCNGGEPYGTLASGPANMSGPSDVGSFAEYANAWGINDMHGNVYEWCEDTFAEYPRIAGIVEDPMNEGNGVVRVIRGGCWNYSPRQCRSAFRTSGNPDWGTEMIGFRLVCDNLP